MFGFRLVLSKIYALLKFVISLMVTFALLGVPFFWALFQRRRLLAAAAGQGWKIIRAQASHDSDKLKKKMNGVPMEVRPDDAFGAQVFAGFSTIKGIDIRNRPGDGGRHDLKKAHDFPVGDPRFDAMFPVHRARQAETNGLLANPDAIESLVMLRSRWMFAISRIEITRHYMLVCFNYGTPLAYYLPSRVLEPFCSEFSSVAALWDAALGYNGQKIND